MAIFKKKSGGTKVGNALRSAFTVPAGSKPVVQINKPSLPTFGSSNLGNTLGNIGSTIKSGVSSIGSVQKPVSKFGTPTITPTVSKNTGVMSGSGQNMSPAIKSQNMSPAFIGPMQGSNRSQNMSPAIKSPNMSPAFIGPMQSFSSKNGGGSWGGSSVVKNTSSNIGSRSGTSYSGTSTGGGTTGTGSGSLATPNGAATIGNEDFNYNKTPQQIAEEEALRRTQDYNDQQSQQDLNYENIMRDTLRQFQGEIDATNQVYADKLRQAGLQGQNRLGQQRAEDFNSGAVNSSFGNAARERVQSYNTDVEGGIQAQKLQSLAQIESQARELGNKYYEQKKAAKESGLAGYLENIKSAGAQKEAIATDIATNMLNAGLTVDEISPAKLEKIAKDAGVPLQQIKTTFKAMKDAMDAAAAEAALKGQFNLSEGQTRNDAQGNLIASNVGGGADEMSAEVMALAKDLNDGVITPQQVPSALRGAVSLARQTLPNPRINELDSVIATIDELAANPKLKNILGPIDQAIGGVFGQAATAKNLYNQLTGILALEGRNKLKGSGAISDFEFRVLKEAQSALGRNLNEAEFKKQLTKVRDVLDKRKQTLMQGTTVSGTSSGGGTFAEAW